jgi:hypothetical protein
VFLEGLFVLCWAVVAVLVSTAVLTHPSELDKLAAGYRDHLRRWHAPEWQQERARLFLLLGYCIVGLVGYGILGISVVIVVARLVDAL